MPPATAQPDTELLPALIVVGDILLPGMTCSMVLGSLRAYGAAREATRSLGSKALGIFAVRPNADLFEVGVAADVVDLRRRVPCGHWVADLRVTGRVKTVTMMRTDPFRIARVERLIDPAESSDVLTSLATAVRQAINDRCERKPPCEAARRAADLLAQAHSPADLAGAALLCLPRMPMADKQRLLECARLSDRLGMMVDVLYGARRADDLPGKQPTLH